MNPIWFMRAKRWAQNPPSMKKVMFVAGIVAVCLILYGIETFIGWPEGLTADRLRPLRP